MLNNSNSTRDSVQNIILFFVDVIGVLIAYYASGIIWLMVYRHMNVNSTVVQLSTNLDTIIVAALISMLFVNEKGDCLKRGRFEELRTVICKVAVFVAMAAVYELVTRRSQIPRGVYICTVFISLVFIYTGRELIKRYLKSLGKNEEKAARVIAITMKDRAAHLVHNLDREEDWVRTLSGFIVMDEDMVSQEIDGVKVVANAHTMMTYIKNEIVDEVYIDVNENIRKHLKPLVMNLEDMGITVHIRIEVLDGFDGYSTSLGTIGNIPVVTFANREFDYKELAVKRLMDIVGSLVGMLIMFVAMIFVVPAIKLESKGPVFFKQKRVGKNGRYFYIYKFRSMYQDAEERKKELMSQNEMSGLMFKMKDDPRITKVGKFIRKTSIDELPQFINVFLGDMSLVGTRPPTVNEFMQYEGHHKRRLSMKPGITGMWQAYGRKTVTDFEDIVKMDLEYIDNWSIGLDIKILFKTIASVVTTGGQ
ncbi:MAG: sugar transferase [Lachnospira sp.]